MKVDKLGIVESFDQNDINHDYGIYNIMSRDGSMYVRITGGTHETTYFDTEKSGALRISGGLGHALFVLKSIGLDTAKFGVCKAN